MKQLNKEVLTYNDVDYTQAINYRHLYNAPITLTYKGKKYIIGAGASDSITLFQEDEAIYILSENYNLDYISLEIINTETDEIQGVFLNSSDINDDETALSYKILDKEAEEQLKILFYYL